jgi:hypothetical protein
MTVVDERTPLMQAPRSGAELVPFAVFRVSHTAASSWII